MSLISLIATIMVVQDVQIEPDASAITQAVFSESSVFNVESQIKHLLQTSSSYQSINGPDEQRPLDALRGELTITEIMQIFSLPPNQLGLTVTLIVTIAFVNALSIAESVLIPILARTNHVFTVSSVILATYLVFYLYHASRTR
jgi:hypothetical protein